MRRASCCRCALVAIQGTAYHVQVGAAAYVSVIVAPAGTRTRAETTLSATPATATTETVPPRNVTRHAEPVVFVTGVPDAGTIGGVVTPGW